MGKNNSYQLFINEAPDVADAFNGLISSLQTGGLDSKTLQLCYIAIKALEGNTSAIVVHVSMAKQAGATWDEVKGAILLTLTVSGVSGVLACLAPAKEAYDEA